MSLRVRRRPDTGSLEIHGTVKPAGSKVGVRIRRRPGSDDEALAREEAAALEAEILRTAWHGERRGVRGFAEAVQSYLRHADRGSRDKALIRRLLRHFGDAPLNTITQEAADVARHVIMPNAAPATVRRNLIVPLRAIVRHAARRGWCDQPWFELPPLREGRTAFLLPDQVEALIRAARHNAPLLRFLLCTGCRLGETLALDWSQVDLRAGRVRLWADQTKAARARSVVLPPAAVIALAGLAHRTCAVFRTHRGEPYRTSEDGGGQIKTALRLMCARAGLPVISTHVMRHTWASWHYAIYRDPLRLKHDGGWSSLSLIERYAHLIPEGHEAAIRHVWGIGGEVVIENRA
jgi:integrase